MTATEDGKVSWTAFALDRRGDVLDIRDEQTGLTYRLQHNFGDCRSSAGCKRPRRQYGHRPRSGPQRERYPRIPSRLSRITLYMLVRIRGERGAAKCHPSGPES